VTVERGTETFQARAIVPDAAERASAAHARRVG